MFEVTKKSLWDQRRSLVGWAIGLAAVAVLYGGFYPWITTEGMESALEGMPQDFLQAMGWDDIGSPAGYLGSTVFGLISPILTIVFGIAVGARAIAGDEESGALEMTITMPLTRRSIVLQRTLSALVAMALAGAVAFLAVVAIRIPVGLDDLPVANIAAASVQLALLGMVHATFAVAVGSGIGRRGIVIGTGAALAAYSYIGNALFSQVDSISWAQKLTTFYYYLAAEPLKHGLDISHSLVLIGLTALFTLVSVVLFDRRDVGT